MITGFASGIVISTLLAIQIALGQPHAGTPSADARVSEQYVAYNPAGSVSSRPANGHVFDPGGRLNVESQSTAAIQKALFEWRLGQTQQISIGHAGHSQTGTVSPLGIPLRPVEEATPDWLSSVAFIFEASEALHQATSFESPGVLVEVDPLNLRCKFTFDLEQIDRLDPTKGK